MDLEWTSETDDTTVDDTSDADAPTVSDDDASELAAPEACEQEADGSLGGTNVIYVGTKVRCA